MAFTRMWNIGKGTHNGEKRNQQFTFGHDILGKSLGHKLIHRIQSHMKHITQEERVDKYRKSSATPTFLKLGKKGGARKED